MSQGAIAERIERDIGTLIQCWTASVRADPRIESDAGLTMPELIDHVPAILAEISQLIGRGETPGVSNTTEARVNVYTRIQQGYSGRDLVRELSLLRLTLVDFVLDTAADTAATGVSPEDARAALRVLNLYLDEEMRYAIMVFSRPAAGQPPGAPRVSPVEPD